jgi:hypothetical protein
MLKPPNERKNTLRRRPAMIALAPNNIRKQLQNFVFGFVVFMMLAACSIQTTVVIANASNRVVTISYKDDSHKISELLLEPGSTQEIKHLLDVHFTIRSSALIANYERAVIPDAYVQNSGFGPFFRRTVKVQLENDKCIYIVNVDVGSGAHPAQPAGFPLCPIAPPN